MNETRYEIIDSRTNEPLSVEDRLHNAQSGEEIQSLLTVGNNARPSGATRRRWLRAAAQAYTRIREAQASVASLELNPAELEVFPECPRPFVQGKPTATGTEQNHSRAADDETPQHS